MKGPGKGPKEIAQGKVRRPRVEEGQGQGTSFQTSTGRMVLLTLIARVTDGLPLAASMEDEQVPVPSTLALPPALSRALSLAPSLAPCPRPLSRALSRALSLARALSRALSRVAADVARGPAPYTRTGGGAAGGLQEPSQGHLQDALHAGRVKDVHRIQEPRLLVRRGCARVYNGAARMLNHARVRCVCLRVLPSSQRLRRAWSGVPVPVRADVPAVGRDAVPGGAAARVQRTARRGGRERVAAVPLCLLWSVRAHTRPGPLCLQTTS